MALRLKNRVKETTTTTGTGSVTMSGTSTGFQSFASALADADTTYYQITDGTNWEIGLGTWDENNNELARTEVFESSNNNSKVSWGAGSKDVFIVMPGEKVSGTTSYGAASDLPLTANQVGDQAFVTATNKLYIWSGSGWYAIATVNETPIVSGNEVSYELANDGTATVVTLTGTDPEGFPLTWSATESGDTDIATTTNVDNVFTITPVTSGDGGTMTVTFSASDGSNTATANSTFTLAFLSPLWPKATLSIGTSSTDSLDNGTLIDRSGNAQTVTVTNNPVQTAFHPYLDNWSVEFDGSGDKFTKSYDAGWSFGSGDFTLEAWFNSIATNQYASIASADSGNNGFAFLLNRSSATAGDILFYEGGGLTLNGATTGLNDGQWHHVAVVRNGSTISLYVDGSLDVSKSVSVSASTAGTLYIGGSVVGSSRDFSGHISNLRIVKGTAIYTSAFTPPTEKLTAVSGTSILTCQSNRFIDNSTNAHAITVGGDPKVSAFNPFGQESEYAVGENKGSVYLATGDEVVIAHDTTTLSAGTNDFCLQFWIYGLYTPNAGTKAITAKYSGGAGSWWIQVSNGVPFLGFSTVNQGGASTNVFDASWHHVALTRSGSAVKLFIDGDPEISITDSSDLNNTADIQIGDILTLSRNMTGYIADYKFDIGNATYTSAFTPPTAPVANTNANLYLPMDNAGFFDKTSNFTLTPEGDASTSTTQAKFGSTAMYFDGTGDYVTIPDDNRLDFRTDFTIEMWVYSTGTATSGNQVIIGGNGSGSNGWTIYSTQGSETVNFFHSAFVITSNAGDLPRNQWVHLAVCRSGSSTKMFVDGTQVGSTYTGTQTFEQGSANLGTRIGYDIGANGYFTGYIDNLQIFDRFAKYTTNFTAPTAEQGRNSQAES